jgi:hypothetical protein
MSIQVGNFAQGARFRDRTNFRRRPTRRGAIGRQPPQTRTDSFLRLAG